MINFINEYHHCLEDCESVIKWADGQEYSAGTVLACDEGIAVKPHEKDSLDIPLLFSEDNPVNDLILGGLGKGMGQYRQDHPEIDTHLGLWKLHESYNIQKYLPGGGYHKLHCEHANYHAASRIFAWMIYLNDCGGGTEFPILGHKVEAEAGKCVIWSAAYTHMHKGIVTQDVKYIATGWFVFDDGQTEG